MSLLRSSFLSAETVQIETAAYLLRPPVLSDFSVWSELRSQSRLFLKPWEPTWPENDLSKASFRRRLRRYAKEGREGRALALLLFSKPEEELLGGVTLSNIRKGVAKMATLGYWMGEPHAGKGHMSAAVKMVLEYCFFELGLHRVEAACLPENKISAHLLEKAGFMREGYARKYLLINGRWQDHILYACLSEDYNAATQVPAH